MEQSQAVWLLIGLAILTAGLPFWLQRTLVLLPWSAEASADRPAWSGWLLSLLHLALLVAWSWAALAWIGHSLAASAFTLLSRLLLMLALLALLFWLPGRYVATRRLKPFVSRLIEVLVLYLLVGVLGFAFETQLGNAFAQGWEFYAITLCLYLILAFPAFVYRYLLGRRQGA